MFTQARSVSPQPNQAKNNQKQMVNMINFIDICTQLLKEDKILLRNLLKNCNNKPANKNEEEDLSALMSIFKSSKKPLNKVPKYERDFHWIQVKLRKYVTNLRKKMKQQSLNQFKENTKNCTRKSSKACLTKVSGLQNQKRSKDRFNRKSTDIPKSPTALREIVRNTREGFKRKAITPKNGKKQEKGSFSPLTSRIKKGTQQSRYSWLDKKFQNIEQPKYEKQQEVQKKEQEKGDHQSSIIENDQENNCWSQFLISYNPNNLNNSESKSKISQCSKSQKSRSCCVYTEEEKNDGLEEKVILHQKSAQKLVSPARKESMILGASFEQISQSYNHTNEKVQKILKESHKIIHDYEKEEKKEQNELFTSPQLLAQCRMFMKKSCLLTSQFEDYKPQSQVLIPQNNAIHQIIPEVPQAKSYYSPTFQPPEQIKKNISFQEYKIKREKTIENIICEKDEIQQVSEKQEVSSEENLGSQKRVKTDQDSYLLKSYENSNKKPFSSTTQKIKEPFELLKEVFKSGIQVYISDLYKTQLIKKAPEQSKQEFKKLFSLGNNRGFLNFLKLSENFSKQLRSKFTQNKIFGLLDLSGKGYVDQKDIEEFIETFKTYEIQKSLEQKLFNSLERLQETLFKKSKLSQFEIGHLQHLQLNENEDLRQLSVILEQFEFQFKDE